MFQREITIHCTVVLSIASVGSTEITWKRLFSLWIMFIYLFIFVKFMIFFWQTKKSFLNNFNYPFCMYFIYVIIKYMFANPVSGKV